MLEISFGRNRSDKNWKPDYLEWGEFVEKLRDVRRTEETMAEYDQMTNAQKGKIKDGPAYVGGLIKKGRRKKENIDSRWIITLDADHADDDFLLDCDLVLGGSAYVIYSTHSHRPTKQKYRLVVPVDREMSPDEYAAVSRKLAEQIGIEYFDKTTFDVHRLMYMPSCSKDAPFVFEESTGEPLEVDQVLQNYTDWRDPFEWPRHPDEKNLRTSSGKMEDPREKNGAIGAFCRIYSISEAIATFLEGVYEPTTIEDRYTYSGSTSYGGVVVYDHDTFAYSHHESDPISGREVNAFDLVRLNKFKDLDEGVSEKTNITKLPSYMAMVEFAANDSKVKREIISDEFGDLEELDETDLDWMSKLEMHPKNPKMVLSNALNAEVIMTHGMFENALAYDAFGNTEVIKSELPWRKRERQQADYEPWLGADDRRLLHYFGKVYKFKSAETIKNAFTEVVHQNAFHPIKEYLEEQLWDGVKRLDTLFIDYLGADDLPYVRAVTRKMFVAAVKRLYEPGCKFDHMLVLVGPQGAGKSSLLAMMGRQWFSDSLRTFDNKEAGEHLQGSWIFEIGELAAMKKAEVEEIKQFLSKENDKYRVAYDRQVSEFPRKCVFFGTTNNHNFLKDTTGNRRFWPVTINPEKRTKNHFDKLSEEVIGQIWAEALSLYERGENLKLDRVIALEAERIQEAHMEGDPREGMIHDYLETPLPDNWNQMDVYARRNYLEQPTGDIERKRVCAAEIWAECLGNDPAKFSVWEARSIYDTLRRAKDWQERVPNRTRFKLYGTQTTFEKV
ncbi:virulence-associated E family protein [Chengkuizengella sp. SCS-71B]|uniref:virulence-associated E family protein n=1 Tax=Chengkuizengella sp. SCS-71B TaxID=3115290 RepID=UPI0032C2377C